MEGRIDGREEKGKGDGWERREGERKERKDREKKGKKNKIIVLSFDDQNELSQKVLPVSLMCCSL